jgi:hypothetical protein
MMKQTSSSSHHPNGSVPCYGNSFTFLGGGANERQFTAKKKKKTYFGKCKIQTPTPAMIGNVC